MKIKRFSVKNYRSFDKEQTVTFNEDDKNVTLIYGPNGAGKSNFFKAILFFGNFIHTSTRAYGQKLIYENFALRKGSEKDSTVFSIELEAKHGSYEYSFALLNGIVKKETLKRLSPEGQKTIFSRNSMKNSEYDKNGFTSELYRTTRPDALVLTRGYETNNEYAIEFFEIFNHIHLISGRQPSAMTAKTTIAKPKYREQVLELLRRSDLFIQDFSVSEQKVINEQIGNAAVDGNVESKIESTIYNVTTSHFLRDENGKVLGSQQFSLQYGESEGANRIFELAYPILDSLENGNVLYIDDFGDSLHTNECRFLVGLFSSSLNKYGAHLIINTHREALMRDVGYKNILLFGKDNFESTSIGKIPGESRDANLENKYIRGDFGAVPRIEDYE